MLRFYTLFRSETKLLTGRWRLDYDQNILDRKIYLTNMDHCGPCGKIGKIGTTHVNHDIEEDLLKYYVM
jgi:hypothetical protein